MNLEIGDSEVCKINFLEFERKQRQFLNELAMKRSQVEELKIELNSAKLKIHEQNRSLESARSTIDEQEHNLMLALKNTRFLEDALQAKKDATSRTHLQQEAAIAERQSLRDLLQKTELQNYNLTIELNELKAQHNCDMAYQKEFINQDAKMREKIEELTETISNFANDQKDILKLSNELESCEKLENAVSFYREEFYKSKAKYKKLEEKYIICKATVDEFEKLCNANNDIFPISQEPNVTLEQSERTIKLLKDQLGNQQEINLNLTNSFKIEKESNIKLCLREKELEIQIDELIQENNILNEKLKAGNKSSEVEEMQAASTEKMNGLNK